MKAHLLCFDCEQRFNRLGESEVLRWLAPKARKQFPLHDRLRVALRCAEAGPYSIYKGFDVGLDTEKFAYFTLSVAWRRSIHEWLGFDGVPMPPWNLGEFGEQMRTFLVGDTGLPPDTCIQVLVCTDAHSREFWSVPTAGVLHNCLAFDFLARGVWFRGLMGHHLPANSRYINCASPYGRILLGHCREETMEKLSILAPMTG